MSVGGTRTAADARSSGADAMRFALLEHAPDGVVVVDHAGVIVYANPRAQVLFGYDRDELIGRPHDDLVAKSLAFEHAALRAAFAKAPSVRAMSDGSGSVSGRRRDGSEFPVEISLSVMGDEDGVLVIAFIRDATASRRLEAERSLAAERASHLSSLAAALGDAVTVAQVAGAILAECSRAAGANGALVLQVVAAGRAVDVLAEGGGASGALETVAESVRGVGFEVTQVDGRRRFAIDAPGPSAEAARSHAPVWLHDGAEIRRRYPAIASMLDRGDCRAMAALPMVAAGVTIGVLRLSFAVERAFDDDEKAFLSLFARKCGLALDRARLYQDSFAARDLAERATMLRDEFLSIVAHELGSPLSVIGLWARLIRDADSSPAGTANVKKGADKIALGVDRIARMLHDLGDVSSIDAGHLSMKREQRDLSAIVTETVESLAPVCAAKGLTIQGTAPPLPLWCDPNRVQQVLGNLVGNAIKFTPEGGSIEVEASPTPWEVVFSVLDTGPGISEQARAHVFDRYWRGKARDVTVGVGLGLFISKGIVEAHGGRIWVDPVAGGGSRFCFTLPIGAPAARGSSALAV